MKVPKVLKDLYNKFASKYDAQDIKAKLTRAAAAGGKSILDKVSKEFPKESIEKAVADIYEALVSSELTDSVTGSIKGLDEEKLQATIQNQLDKLKDPEKAAQIAASLKQILTSVTPEQVGELIEGLVPASASLATRSTVMFIVSQLKPILEDIKELPEDQVVGRLMDLADLIPADYLAQQAANLTGNISPETINKTIQEKIAKLPSPNAVADVVDGAANVVKDKFSSATRAKTPETTKKALTDIVSDIKKVTQETIQKDKENKSKFKGGKKGKNFEV